MNELKWLSKDIREKFNEKIAKEHYVFGLGDVMLEKITYSLLSFKKVCNCSYCQRDSKTAGKCDVCTRFFIDGNSLGVKIDKEFFLTNKVLVSYQFSICLIR